MIEGPIICLSGGKKGKNGKIVNEDKVINGKGYAILMDGATGLGDFQFNDDMTDAEWYVKECSEFIQRKLETNPKDELSEIVLQCIEYIGKEIKEMEEKSGYKLSRFENPSSSLIILREIDGITDVFSLGDSITMIKMKSGDFTILREENLCKLDKQVLDRMAQIAKEKQINVIETVKTEEIKKMLIINREKNNSNKEDGYWILSTQTEAIEHAKQVKIPSIDIEKIVCVSDGFNYKIQGLSDEQFLNECTSENILEFANQSIKEEEKDCSCNKCHRFKVHDDISGFVWMPKEN